MCILKDFLGMLEIFLKRVDKRCLEQVWKREVKATEKIMLCCAVQCSAVQCSAFEAWFEKVMLTIEGLRIGAY